MVLRAQLLCSLLEVMQTFSQVLLLLLLLLLVVVPVVVELLLVVSHQQRIHLVAVGPYLVVEAHALLPLTPVDAPSPASLPMTSSLLWYCCSFARIRASYCPSRLLWRLGTTQGALLPPLRTFVVP